MPARPSSSKRLRASASCALLAIGSALGAGCQASPMAGGNTSDFSGSRIGCTGEDSVPLDERSAELGYEPNRIVAPIEGRHEASIVWINMCSPGSCFDDCDPDG